MTEHAASWRGLLAVAAGLLLAGCANGELSMLGSTLSDWAASDRASRQQAESIPYASLALETPDRSGLVVLGAAAGAATYWPTGNHGLITLFHDGVQATEGLPQDLLETRYYPAGGEADADYVPWQTPPPEDFRLVRRWEGKDGLPRQMTASGRLTCEAARPHALPLGERSLQPCAMRLEWQDGKTTRASLWRDPETLRLWAVDSTPWPGGPRIRWEVARAWW